MIDVLLDDGRIPVVSSVGPRRDDGGVYNVNADTAAAALAVGLGAEKLVVLTDVEGLYADWPRPDEVISRARRATELERCCPPCPSGMVPEDGGLPARGARRRAGGPRRSTAGCRTRCCSRSSPKRGSAPWWCRHDARQTEA